MSSYFASLVTKPNMIVAPGRYLTRSGEEVTVAAVSTRHDFGCTGNYASGVREGWHKSGRILATSETPNDIVAALTSPRG